MPRRNRPRQSKGKPKYRMTKEQERAGIEHTLTGWPPFTPGKKPFDFKGTQIKAQSGIKDLNPEPQKGVEIHDPRHG